MSHYLFNRQEILEKAKDIYSKEKAAEYYLKNKEAIKEKSKNRYKNSSKEEKEKIKVYQRKRYQELTQFKLRLHYNPNKFILRIIKINEKTLRHYGD